MYWYIYFLFGVIYAYSFTVFFSHNSLDAVCSSTLCLKTLISFLNLYLKIFRGPSTSYYLYYRISWSFERHIFYFCPNTFFYISEGAIYLWQSIGHRKHIKRFFCNSFDILRCHQDCTIVTSQTNKNTFILVLLYITFL